MWTRVPRDLVNITPHIPRRVESNVSRIVPSFLSFPDNLSPWACHLIKTVFLNISLPSAKHSLLKPSVYCSLPFTNASPEAQFPVHAHRHIKKAIYSLTAEARKTGSVHRYLGCGFHWPLHSKCEVCVCVCLSVCKRERACVCICMYTCVCTAHVSVSVYNPEEECVCAHICVFVCVHRYIMYTHWSLGENIPQHHLFFLRWYLLQPQHSGSPVPPYAPNILTSGPLALPAGLLPVDRCFPANPLLSYSFRRPSWLTGLWWRNQAVWCLQSAPNPLSPSPTAPAPLPCPSSVSQTSCWSSHLYTLPWPARPTETRPVILRTAEGPMEVPRTHMTWACHTCSQGLFLDSQS